MYYSYHIDGLGFGAERYDWNDARPTAHAARLFAYAGVMLVAFHLFVHDPRNGPRWSRRAIVSGPTAVTESLK